MQLTTVRRMKEKATHPIITLKKKELEVKNNGDENEILKDPKQIWCFAVVTVTLHQNFKRSKAELNFYVSIQKECCYIGCYYSISFVILAQIEFISFSLLQEYKEAIEAAGFVHEGSYSLVDVEKVDLKKFPRFAETKWKAVNMRAGDCVYIPKG